ncbi:acetoacetate decarboxylase family protein [Cytobacillus oceanisediminis]
MDVTYPPEPWDLHGQALASVFLVPAADLPAPPPGTTIVTLRGRAVVTAAFFRYEEPSPLTYDEIMATVLVRRGLRFRVWIPWIWVDSEASRDGGRALWAIPKHLAEFRVEPGRRHEGLGLASATVERTRALPGRWPLGFRIAQARAGRSVVTPVRGRVSAQLVRASWTFDGVLGLLSGRRPVVSLRVPRFALLFGRRSS